MTPAEEGSTRTRLLEGARRCVLRWSVSKTSLGDIASEAGVSRATLYRTFPGGREEIISSLVHREVDRFFGELAERVVDVDDLTDLVVHGVFHAQQMIADHALFHRVMDTEPELILPLLTTESRRIRHAIAEFCRPWLERAELRPGVEVEAAGDYIARMLLSYIDSPGSFDLTDMAVVRHLVATQFLAGLITPPAPAS